MTADEVSVKVEKCGRGNKVWATVEGGRVYTFRHCPEYYLKTRLKLTDADWQTICIGGCVEVKLSAGALYSAWCQAEVE